MLQLYRLGLVERFRPHVPTGSAPWHYANRAGGSPGRACGRIKHKSSRRIAGDTPFSGPPGTPQRNVPEDHPHNMQDSSTSMWSPTGTPARMWTPSPPVCVTRSTHSLQPGSAELQPRQRCRGDPHPHAGDAPSPRTRRRRAIGEALGYRRHRVRATRLWRAAAIPLRKGCHVYGGDGTGSPPAATTLITQHETTRSP